jgi:MoaA/NifB/PqqE/SkfB family radical SAM enzyme
MTDPKKLPSAKQPYSTQKIIHHPEVLRRLREREQQPPVQIHFMPALACPQHCTFCSYGHRTKEDGEDQQGWKNMEMMSDAFLPRDKMLECVESWKAMGVKAVEITGGGEPLIWPCIDEFFELAVGWGVDLGLVTNGIALTEARADLYAATNWKWARVSIDAGSQENYCATRRVPASHWDKAWRAVRFLAERKTDPEQRVGVGYVVDRSNWESVFAGVALAKEAGADNVRISAAFTPHGTERFTEEAISEASKGAAAAKDAFEDEGFQVNNLFDERIANLVAARQDYAFCSVKEVVCIVGGDQNVYTCCTLAFTPKGLVGSFKDQSFQELWEGGAKEAFFAGHRADVICDMECLYEKRNKETLRLLEATADELGELRKADTSIHRNFI